MGRLILRLVEPTSGTVRFDGQDVLAASGSELRPLRRQMQIIFQDPVGSLDPRMRVEEIVVEPLRIDGMNGLPGFDPPPSTGWIGRSVAVRATARMRRN